MANSENEKAALRAVCYHTDVRMGAQVYVAYRATAKSKPHAKRVKVVGVQATLSNGVSSVTVLGEDANGISYVYPCDQLFLDINNALHYVAAQSLREDLGLDELCHMADPRFKWKRKVDYDSSGAASGSRAFKAEGVDGDERRALVERINQRVLSAEYWRGMPKK